MSKQRGTTLSPGEQEVFLGAFQRASISLSHEIDPVTAEEWSSNVEVVKNIFRREFLPPPPDLAKGVVKTVVVIIGGGRTTDQIVTDTLKKCDNCIHSDIKQANMPAGHGRRRPVVLEFFEFTDHKPTTEEVRARCEEPGYGYPQYEDSLRFQEDHPDDQRERPHIVIPENPWCDADGIPQALGLWIRANNRELFLSDCSLGDKWIRHCLFARRKYC